MAEIVKIEWDPKYSVDIEEIDDFQKKMDSFAILQRQFYQ